MTSDPKTPADAMPSGSGDPAGKGEGAGAPQNPFDRTDGPVGLSRRPILGWIEARDALLNNPLALILVALAFYLVSFVVGKWLIWALPVAIAGGTLLAYLRQRRKRAAGMPDTLVED
jgi:hypothetical protein